MARAKGHSITPHLLDHGGSQGIDHTNPHLVGLHAGGVGLPAGSHAIHCSHGATSKAHDILLKDGPEGTDDVTLGEDLGGQRGGFGLSVHTDPSGWVCREQGEAFHDKGVSTAHWVNSHLRKTTGGNEKPSFPEKTGTRENTGKAQLLNKRDAELHSTFLLGRLTAQTSMSQSTDSPPSGTGQTPRISQEFALGTRPTTPFPPWGLSPSV